MRRPDTVQHEEGETELKRKMPGLNAFEAASTSGSFTRATERFMMQSAVSR
jgi:alpha-acetolactate decarboxylase